ncbi:MAG: LysR family transcriptional regulator [Rhizobiaceae bacterium]|nr:LysR family transcriptional regulator [Rhizobiaceae bacterium]
MTAACVLSICAKTTCLPVDLVSGIKLCCSTKMKNEFRNWSDVRIFLMVVREGSTLAASHQLGIAQPTVARRIEALENETGLTLFERDTRGFKPTEEAMVLLPLAEAIEQAAGSFAAKVKEMTTSRPIRITAHSGNFSPRMTEILNEFAVIWPDVTFELLPGVDVLDLMAGEADIALRLIRSEPDKDLICRNISMARWALFAGHSYAEKYGLPKSAHDLKGHRFLTYERGDRQTAFHRWLLERVSPDQIVMSFREVDLMHAAMRSGRGLGISNVKLVESDDTLIRCFDEIEELTVPHMMLIAPAAYRRPEVKAFVKYFAPRYAAIFK